jgi:hypothetical protein
MLTPTDDGSGSASVDKEPFPAERTRGSKGFSLSRDTEVHCNTFWADFSFPKSLEHSLKMALMPVKTAIGRSS